MMKTSFTYALPLAIGALLGAGCSPASPQSPTVTFPENAVPASQAVQSSGIAAYVVGPTQVTLLGADGSTFGTLAITSPSATERDLTFANAAGSTVTEVTRPLHGKFVAPAYPGELESDVELDAALAPFFAGSAITFTTPQHLKTKPGLATEDSSSCSGIPWTQGCTYASCQTPYGQTQWYSSYDAGDAYDCDSLCESQGAYPGGVPDGEPSDPDPNECDCTIYFSQSVAWANCTPTHYGCGSNYDVNQKTQNCQDPGSCVNQANGFVHCM